MSTKTVTIQDVQSRFSEILTFALKGNEIIIVENDTKIARLIPIPSHNKTRISGLNRGKIWMSDDFDMPLSDDFWLGSK